MKNSPKINILLGNDHLGWKGTHLHGVGRYFLNIIPEFSDNVSIVPCILRKKDALDSYFNERNIKITYFGREKFDPRTLFDFLSVIKKSNIQLMHLQGYAATTFGRIAGLLTNVPVIIHQRDADPNHPGYMIIPDIILARSTRLALSVSQYTKKFLSYKRKIPLDKIKVVINPVNIKKIRSLNTSKLAAIKQLIHYDTTINWVGTITRFYPIKGVDCLIKSIPFVIHKHKNVKFVICGDGPLMDDMKSLAKDLGVFEYVLFPGFVDDPELWTSLFDIVVSTSNSEGCPNSLLEAMALGKPIVCTNSGGPQEFLKDGISALMVKTGDMAQIAHSISKLLDNATLRKIISTNTLASVKSYSMGQYIESLENNTLI